MLLFQNRLYGPADVPRNASLHVPRPFSPGHGARKSYSYTVYEAQACQHLL